MAQNVCTPIFEDSDVTYRATAAVIGKRFIAPSGARTGGPGLSTDLQNVYRMAHAPAGGAATGVSRYDTPVDGLSAVFGKPGRIVPVTAVAAIAAGQRIEVGAAGQAQPLATAGAVPVAIAMTSAVAGADVEAKIL